MPLLSHPLPSPNTVCFSGAAHVIDPKNNIDGPRDVAVQAGKIAEVSASIDPSRARRDDRRRLPVFTSHTGLVDMHTHLFHTTGIRADLAAGDNSVQPGQHFSFRSGTTAMVDAWRVGLA